MPQLLTFADAEAALTVYMPLAHEIIGKDLTLSRMRPLMVALGNPEQKLKILHIAGTSGKTSTAYYMASLLRAAGKKVGLTVSPHMDSVAERVQINLQPLSEADFCQNLGTFLDLLEKTNIKPTYYELLIAFAFWYFAQAGVDYAVIETGLGGLHDCTNVTERPDKICIITDIGYDHMHVLGKTLPEISAQKAGIIHAGNQVFMFKQSQEVMASVESWCASQPAELHELEQSSLRETIVTNAINAMPSFKQRNWLLAYAVYNYVQHRDNSPKLNLAQINQSLTTYVPGRMDEVIRGDKTIIMDGAHNDQKMTAFVDSFKHQFPGRQATVLLAMKQNKDYSDVLNTIKPISGQLILTNFSIGQDRQSAGVNPDTLRQAAERADYKNILVEPNLPKAYAQALSRTPKNGILVVTGSLYLLSQLRHTFKELRHA